MATTINAGTSTSGAAVSADTTGILQLQSGSTPTTAVTIDTSQNVGIGTTSPSHQLDVANGARAKYVQILNNGYAGSAATTPELYSPAAATLAIAAGGTERMRIDSSGNLLVGQTSQTSAEKLGITASVSNFASIFTNTAASNPYGIKMRYTGTSPNNSGTWFYYAEDSAAAQKFGVASNGGVQNYSANNVNLSDAREKTNVELAGSYLDKICAIPVKTFNYIDQNLEEDGGLTLGVIAQDVEAVAPELVMESNWGSEEEPKMRLSIYQTDLQYALMKAIQEQQAIISDLKARIETLEAK